MSMYFGTGSYKIPLLQYLLSQPVLVALNTAPFVILILLLWCVFCKAWIAFLLSGLFCLAYSWGVFWKIMARNDPVYAGDVFILKDAAKMSGQYIFITWQILLSAFLVILGTLVIGAIFKKRREFPRFMTRLILFLLLIALSLGSYFAIYRSDELYDSFEVWDELNMWFENNQFFSRGSMYPFIHSIKDAVPKAPDGYSEEEAREILSGYRNDDIPKDKRINVIAVMFEAYSDLSAYTDKISGEDPYEAYHKLQAESYTGRLVVNVFGGGTIDTERCVVTGFPSIGNLRQTSWSYARWFETQGYKTTGSHSGYADFYNRINVNRNLGFSEYFFLDDHYIKYTSWPSGDAILLPEIGDMACDIIEGGSPVFSFNVTYQNHGPYSAGEKNFEKEYVPSGVLSESSYMIINNYLKGIEDTSERMLEMTERFRDYYEPVVLLFFGDHKPWLGDQSQVYAELGIDFDSESDESFYNYYGTEYLIWANETARKIIGSDCTGEGPSVSPCFLMDILFERMGWSGPSCMKLSRSVMNVLSVVSESGKYLQKGSLVAEDGLTLENYGLLMKMRRAAFYLEYDSEGQLP
ncbi:MAG: LTA synthase family protein [Firmicutes bacterium]|nr:LTA synthase family protein [Bacillota bacterium]